MLILTRKSSEEIVLYDEERIIAVFCYCELSKGEVLVYLSAPEDVRIVRGEIFDQRKEIDSSLLDAFTVQMSQIRELKADRARADRFERYQNHLETKKEENDGKEANKE